jgi:ribonuclease Y
MISLLAQSSSFISPSDFVPIIGTIFSLILFFLGVYSGVWIERRIRLKEIDSADERAKNLMARAEDEAEHLIKTAELEAKELLHDMRMELNDTRRDIERREEIVNLREAKLIDEEQIHLNGQKELEKQLQEAESLLKRARTKLEKAASLSEEEARARLLADLEKDLHRESAALIRESEQKTGDEAKRRAQKLISQAAMQCASEVVQDVTATNFPLESEEMKGWIIGKEGRNIKALESATGVNFIIDESPEVVVLSSFDPMRREVARLSLEKLLVGGRISPARIEEVVAEVETELEQQVQELGSSACFDLGLHDAAPELMTLLGRLHYRTSYAQNVLLHSIEVANLMTLMADELGLDSAAAKRAGLFHDVGKALNSDHEGPHALTGAEFCRKHGEQSAVVHAIAAHHNDEPPRSAEAFLLQAADAISAARPGARLESLNKYIQRLTDLEAIARRHEGVSQVYALQAGREVRVIVEPDKLDDDACVLLARKVREQIELDLQYPGQIKVLVIRETRVADYAR